MEFKYYVCDPTGNITLLAICDAEPSLRPTIAARLMESEPGVEQVGFISDNGLTLNMAGGEFCGNASMSAGSLYLKMRGIEEGRVSLSVSGAVLPIEVSGKRIADDRYRCTVKMPPVKRVTSLELEWGSSMRKIPAVEMDGITHLILGEDEMSREEAEKAVVSWCRKLNAECLGIMFLDELSGKLTPLVYVPGSDTLFWESSCGSGSCAVGAYLADKTGKPVEVELKEPAGNLKVAAVPGKEIFLTGTVALGCEKVFKN